MDVVKTIDQLVTSLSPRLMAETDRLTIQSPNISESCKSGEVLKSMNQMDWGNNLILTLWYKEMAHLI